MQVFFNISGIFNFAVPLWLTRIVRRCICWTPFRIGHFALQFPYFTKFADQCGNIESLYLLVHYAYSMMQGLWCKTKYLDPINFRIFSNLTSRCDWSAYSHTDFSNLTSRCDWSALWWTPFRIGHFARQLPYFTSISPKFDRLVWLNYACPWLPIYRVGNYGYVGLAQEIWCHYTYWLPQQGSDARQNIF